MWKNDTNFDETNGGFLNNTTSETPAKEKGARRLQNVTPVCIRQIRDCNSDDFNMFGLNSQMLSLVVILRNMDVSSTKATYMVEDHTGTISAILWLDNDSSSSVNLPSVKEGHYCKIYGSLRIIDGSKTILILKMMPIEDMNEITTHLLEVIHVRFATEKMARDANSSVNIAQNNPSSDLANSMSMMYENQSSDNHFFTPMQQKVYKVLKELDKDDNGVSIDQIKARFPPAQHREFQNAMDYLSAEGHVYTTIDQNHFKPTD